LLFVLSGCLNRLLLQMMGDHNPHQLLKHKPKLKWKAWRQLNLSSLAVMRTQLRQRLTFLRMNRMRLKVSRLMKIRLHMNCLNN